MILTATAAPSPSMLGLKVVVVAAVTENLPA